MQVHETRSANGFTKASPEQLRETLARHRQQRHLILLQDFPDPDALSAAWAWRLICQPFEITVDVVHAGVLSHQENVTLVKLTNLPLLRWQKVQGQLANYQGVVLLDNQGTTCQGWPAVQEAKIPLIAVVDHHQLQEPLVAEFSDIRPDQGATATMLTQYLQGGGFLQLSAGNPEHIKVATALMHGIRSETLNLLAASEEDFLAAAALSRFYDNKLLQTILQSSRSRKVMEVIQRALANREVRNNFSVSGVGYLAYGDRDAIPQAADFLLTEENVHTVLVFGIITGEDEREILTGSLRTNKLTLDPDEFLKTTLGCDAQGRYFGGGRQRAGGFEIPIGFLTGAIEDSEYSLRKWQVYDLQIKQKLAKVIDPHA
ncbi:DHH family phosphoesterase [Anthocerotibacter panamensis]|uniref:DHH family phosphoesterase n=1 Tax=Anthocerotibacter panamensis TaxID=2857077 RepID=UPI001C408A6E|nr:bifunctional oligoribonuclease/PAP phosphatase NrnA [Anthocerotibacter panamensis]